MKTISIVLCFLIFNSISATEFVISAESTYKTPNQIYLAIESGEISLALGDTISIHAGTYRGTDVLAVWRTSELLVRGINGRADLYADGEYIIGKGIFVSQGDNITYENIGFYDASVPDQNGAGIRLDGAGLTVRNCLFYNNENGILANNSEDGRVLIEHSEFAVGGFGDGFSHNIYINHCAELIIQFSYFHSASIGHQIKSRADKNVIQYNRIADLDGNSSRLIDLPNGGQSTILGNEIVQGLNAENNNLIGYGLEGLSNPGPHSIKIVHNTILNYRENSCNYFHVTTDSDSFLLVNNILGGTCNLFIDKEAIQSYNVIEEDISAIGFLDTEILDLGLLPPTVAEDFATADIEESLIPQWEYVHPMMNIPRSNFMQADAGAHEVQYDSGADPLEKQSLTFQNPVLDEIIFSEIMIGSYTIHSTNGITIQVGTISNNRINVSGLVVGMYILSLENSKTRKFLKI